MAHREERTVHEKEELKDLLEDLLMRVQEIQEVFTIALEDLADMIKEA